MSTSHKLRYRRDIDGLRCIAILPVLIFHLFPHVFPGGFVGVDVFFVISGYLITGIISREFQADEFSLRRFYERRARRILPSLNIVMSVTLILGALLFYSDEFKELCFYAASGMGFVANLALWSHAGYFDTASETKPLLHLWSLGVEEQFYFFWPLLLFLFGQCRARRWLITLSLTLISFALALHFSTRHPTMNFYSPMTRFWEIFIGAILALWSQENPNSRLTNAATNFASIGGALALIAGFVFCGDNQAFPNWTALLPTLGTALLIVAGENAVANRFLSLEPIVATGRISYSMYLWHWPLIVYSKILWAGKTPPAFAVGIGVLSALLAWITYRLVETPVRLKQQPALFSTSRIALFSTLIFTFGIIFKGNRILPEFPSSMRVGITMDSLAEKTCSVSTTNQKLFEYCRADGRGAVNAALWGDSKAHAFFGGLLTQSPTSLHWELVSQASCGPYAFVNWLPKPGDARANECNQGHQTELLELIEHVEIKTVMLVSANRVLYDQDYAPADHFQQIPGLSVAESGLQTTIQELLGAHKRVILLLDNPTLPDVRAVLPRRISFRTLATPSIPLAEHEKRTARYKAFAEHLKRQFPDLIVYDPADALCANGVCPVSENGSYLYSYTDHVSDIGADKVMRDLFARNPSLGR